MTGPQSVWMTRSAYERLQAELNELLDTHDEDESVALDHLQARKSRIAQIRDLLSHATVGEDPPDDGIAEPGMVLTVRFDDTEETETFLLGVRDVDPGDMEVYSPQSPLGTALAGARPGEQRTYRVPSGASISVTLLAAVPYGQRSPEKQS
ncbi:GreA/GreB family elongation factor [Mycobacterium sp. 1274756.6]|uniref:GreA/GreB family elongation factor n=1 Tax=Mycobacterium sp. 1274756.6 TaxID=1834076 RepID=UPI0008019F37|nr:GreA/GreB family elongation factor [Mycobacterium sp. 1274756.6]OBJ71446.1 transcription elongation factor GreAB [Mycobacterium sp. 1274756.6]